MTLIFSQFGATRPGAQDPAGSGSWGSKCGQFREQGPCSTFWILLVWVPSVCFHFVDTQQTFSGCLGKIKHARASVHSAGCAKELFSKKWALLRRPRKHLCSSIVLPTGLFLAWTLPHVGSLKGEPVTPALAESWLDMMAASQPSPPFGSGELPSLTGSFSSVQWRGS